MEKCAFIGNYDKTDLILQVAKILTILNKKVLVIDSTALQKSRYIVPTMTPTQKYITTFEKIDVAVGFENMLVLKQFMGVPEHADLDYDYVLIDVDSPRGYVGYQIAPTDKQYFVTSFDMYSLKRGLQTFIYLKEQVKVTKILFTKDMLPEEDEYLNFLSKKLKIKWNSEIVFFPFELGDQSAIYANQRSSRIRIKGLSVQYVDGIAFIAEDITGEKSGLIRKAVRVLEKN